LTELAITNELETETIPIDDEPEAQADPATTPEPSDELASIVEFQTATLSI
jgi:hypothetical protein